jgi:hypothetical protein
MGRWRGTGARDGFGTLLIRPRVSQFDSGATEPPSERTADGLSMTLGSPLVSPGFAGYVSADRRRLMARAGGQDQTSYFSWPGLSVDPGTCGARINSRCIRSTIVVSALLHLSRSALPNRTPLIVQFASRRALGVSRCTITPAKASQSGLAFLTASVIADSKRSRETELRSVDDFLFGCQAKTASSRQKYD